MLLLSDITHRYGTTPVLHGVNLALAAGRVLSLAGPSGCGKTTLLHIAAGLLRPQAGQVQNTFQRSALVFQEPRLLPWRSSYHNLAFGLHVRTIPHGRRFNDERHARVLRLAARLGLHEALHKYPHQLSGGLRQRVALGRALAVHPDLLLLDEPFSALDVGLRRDLHDLLLDLIAEQNLAALCITHDLTEAVRLGDELLVLAGHPGRVVYHWVQDRHPCQRDAAYIHETVAALLREQVVISAFGLAR